MRQTFGGFNAFDQNLGHGAYALGAPPQDDRDRGRDRNIARRDDMFGGVPGMQNTFRDMEEHFVSLLSAECE